MGEHTSRMAELVVRVAAAHAITPEKIETTGSELAPTRACNAFVYTKLDLKGWGPVHDLLEDQPRELSGLPLVAIEKVVIDWSYHRKYLGAFVGGEKAATGLLSGKQMFKEISPGLASLFRGELQPKQSLRVWWSTDSPSLTKLPWELLVHGNEGGNEAISFVRGLPPDKPVPKLPVGEKLRLAFIHESSTTPPTLAAALEGIEHIELIDMPGNPLEALQEAITKNYELIHLVSDGSVSLANEGYLYLRRPDTGGHGNRLSRWMYRMLLDGYQKLGPSLPQKWSESWGEKLGMKLNIETLSASALSALQRGRQLAVLSLSPPNTDDESADRIDGVFLPSIFSAFACIGGSTLPMPNIIAQVGACNIEQLGDFWRRFYSELASSLEIEKAFGAGLGKTPLPIALFLRQRYRHTFKRQLTEQVENVPQLNAELQLSKETLQQLKALKGSRFEEIVAAFEQQMSVRQQELQGKLDPWLEDQESDESDVEAKVAEQ